MSLTRGLLSEDGLEKATRACALLANASVLDRAIAYGYKGSVLRDLRRIGETLATFQEARQLYTLAGTHLGGSTGEAIPWHAADSSRAVLFELGGLLESANELAESEQYYIELLSMPGLPVENRIQCLHSLVHVNYQPKKWGKGLQYGKEEA